jgi:hypothetical protein
MAASSQQDAPTAPAENDNSDDDASCGSVQQITEEELKDLMDDDDTPPSLSNIDGIVIIALLLCAAVIFGLHDSKTEAPAIFLTIGQIILCAAGRYCLAWWSRGQHITDWRSLLAWRNIGFVFWVLQLGLAIKDGKSIAPNAHQRLQTMLVAWTFLLAGFLIGVEPGSGKRKLFIGIVNTILIVIRLAVLASYLREEYGGAKGETMAWELMQYGLASQVLSPLLGTSVGFVTRAKLDAQSTQMRQVEQAYAGVRSDAAELSWLRRHAMELEMARQEALVRRTKAATEGQSNGVGGTRRRNNPNNNHKQGEAERKILAQVRELYHERASSELASRSE